MHFPDGEQFCPFMHCPLSKQKASWQYPEVQVSKFVSAVLQSLLLVQRTASNEEKFDRIP